MENKEFKRQKRKNRIKGNINAKNDRLRLSVYRSNNYIYAQIIDDLNSKTICSFSDVKLEKKSTNLEKAKLVGLEIAKLAKLKKVNKVVFDRNGYKYHGRVKALADGAREGGLEF